MKQALLIAATLCSVISADQVLQPAAANLIEDAHQMGSQKLDTVYDDPKFAFVFEVVRHGARTPITTVGLDEFSVSEGILTPEGMRQRYLLGRYNRERYITESGFLSETYNQEEFYIQSTNVNRTMQSGYSELLGLYPPYVSNDEQLTRAQVQGLESGIGLPPFKVRQSFQINAELGFVALPHDFTAVPIQVFNNADIHDDCSPDGCPLIGEVRDANADDESIWTKYFYYRETTKEALAKSVGQTVAELDADSFHSFESVTDADTARDFEGTMNHADFFTEEEWQDTLMFQRFWLSEDFGEQGRDLMLSRMLRKPIKEMQTHISDLVALREGSITADAMSKLKYMIYSAHDDQIDNSMVWLTQTMASFDHIPYASQVIYELKYSETCLAESSELLNCFGVSVAYNGTPLKFNGCSGDGFSQNLSGCKWNEFMAYMDTIWYSGPNADDLDQACYNHYSP